MSHSHRSSWLKQKNKAHTPFKRKKSKSAIKRQTRGKVEERTESIKEKIQETKSVRRNQAKQRQENQRNARLRLARSAFAAPKRVVFIPLHSVIDVVLTVSALCPFADGPSLGPLLRHQKQRIDCVPSPSRGQPSLEHARTADHLVLCIPAVVAAELIAADEEKRTVRSQMGSSASVLTAASFVKQAAAGVIDEEGLLLLSLLKGQGLPPVSILMCGMDQVPMKKRNTARKNISNTVEHHFGPGLKLFTADAPSDAKVLLRHLAQSAFDPPTWRRDRSFIVPSFADPLRAPKFTTPEGAPLTDQQIAQIAVGVAETAFQADVSAVSPECRNLIQKMQAVAGTDAPPLTHVMMCVEGYLRGAPLSPDDLVHVGGVGDFQLHCIQTLADPFPRKEREEVDECTYEPTDAQESLQAYNVPDPLLGEQTWPTEEDLEGSDADDDQDEHVRMVPRGTSAYQAAWIMDDDSDQDDEDLVPLDEEEARLNPEPQGRRSHIRRKYGERRKGMDPLSDDDDDDSSHSFDGMSDDDEEKAFLERIDARARDEVQFPDEADVKPGEIARDIFRGWRGLPSFRNTPWDKHENLPPEYARLYQFSSFKRARALELRNAYTKPVDAGSYVRLVVRVPLAERVAATTHCRLTRERDAAAPPSVVSGSDGVSSSLPAQVGGDMPTQEYATAPDVRVPLFLALLHEMMSCATPIGPLTPVSRPFVLSGLFKHEHKLTVMHALLKRHQSYASPVRNGEPLVLLVGFRRLAIRPIFSAADIGVDKHKYERFLQQGSDSMASFYAPVCVGPAPVLALREHVTVNTDCIDFEGRALVAVGSIREPNADRIVLRKAVLTGAPIRIHKRFAIVSGMFHNPDDVEYFKTIELWTKHGRSGHILESRGTHGRMKCQFDGVVHQHDTVCMSLYTRQFPPWPISDAELRLNAELFAGKTHVPLVREFDHPFTEVDNEEVGVSVGYGPIAAGL